MILVVKQVHFIPPKTSSAVSVAKWNVQVFSGVLDLFCRVFINK